MQSFFQVSNLTGQTVKQFAFEFALALSQSFQFQGRIDPGPLAEGNPVRYLEPAEALRRLEALDSLSLFSIEHSCFYLLFDIYEDGIELLFKALTSEACALLPAFTGLAQSLLSRLSPAEAHSASEPACPAA